MSQEEKQKCIDATKHLYEKYDSWFSPGILRSLALAQNKYEDVFKQAA